MEATCTAYAKFSLYTSQTTHEANDNGSNTRTVKGKCASFARSISLNRLMNPVVKVLLKCVIRFFISFRSLVLFHTFLWIFAAVAERDRGNRGRFLGVHSAESARGREHECGADEPAGHAGLSAAASGGAGVSEESGDGSGVSRATIRARRRRRTTTGRRQEHGQQQQLQRQHRRQQQQQQQHQQRRRTAATMHTGEKYSNDDEHGAVTAATTSTTAAAATTTTTATTEGKEEENSTSNARRRETINCDDDDEHGR